VTGDLIVDGNINGNINPSIEGVDIFNFGNGFGDNNGGINVRGTANNSLSDNRAVSINAFDFGFGSGGSIEIFGDEDDGNGDQTRFAFVSIDDDFGNSTAPGGTLALQGSTSGSTVFMTTRDANSFVALNDRNGAFNNVTLQGNLNNSEFGGVTVSSNLTSDNLVSITGFQDVNGADAGGFAGSVEVNGAASLNISLAANSDTSHDLPALSMFGEHTDGGDFFNRNFAVNVFSDGTNNWPLVQLFNTVEGSGGEAETIFLDGGDGSARFTGALDASIFNSTSGDDRSVSTGAIADFDTGLPFYFMFGDDGAGNFAEVEIRTFEDGIGNDYGSIFLRGAGNNVNINLDGSDGSVTAITVNQTSDQRLKKNIIPLDNALANVVKLRGVSYQWKDQNKDQRNQIGVIAQEVEEIYPEFVHTDKDGMKSVNYAQMTAVLIEAVKELNAKIGSLETENASLKAQVEEIDEMKDQIAKIRQLLNLEVSDKSFKASSK
jgi:hypothetical protein